ncbi:MAG: ATP-binding protein [Spirochaetota bacterium]
MIQYQGRRSFRKKVLCALLFLLAAVPCFASAPVNLCARDIYMRQGFDLSWIQSLPSGDAEWMKFEANPVWKKLRIPDMNLPGKPQHRFFSFAENNPETFTFVTSFPLSSRELAESPLFGLYLAKIGVNWEIYINGTLIRKEVYLAEDGAIGIYRCLGMALIPVDVRLLRQGENVLAYKIIGDPAYRHTGFQRQNGYLFGSFDRLSDRFGRINQAALIFCYFVLGMFAVFMFVGRRADKYIMYYGLLSLVVGTYIFARSPFSYEVFLDSRAVFTLEYVSLFFVIPAIGAMFDHFIASEVSLFTKIVTALCALCAAGVLVSPAMVDSDILRIWQISSVIPIIYYPYMIFRKGVVPDYREISTAVESGNGFVRTARIIFKTMAESYAGILLLGIASIVICSVLDIVDSLFFSKGILLTQYGVFGFTVSVGLVLTAKYNAVHRMLEKLNVELEEKVLTINEAHSRLTLSEEKYRFLVDYSSDYIFILNTDGSFVSASSALLKDTRIRSDNIGKHSFFELLFSDGPEYNIDSTLIHDNFNNMIEGRSKTCFKAKFRSAGILDDPKDFNVFLDYISIDGKDLILGKAVHAGNDTLQEFYLSENQKYRINNYLFSAEQMSRRIADHSGKYLTRDECDTLHVSIREILINAIEHGNLAVSYAEKTEAMDNDSYFEFIRERQKDPLYRARHVNVEFSIDENALTCTITDDGDGFDHRKIMDDQAKSANERLLEHGRGLYIANNFFDEVSFSEKGNQVLLVKHISADRSA